VAVSAFVFAPTASAGTLDQPTSTALDSALTTILVPAVSTTTTTAPVLPPGCTRLYMQKQFRTLAERAYREGEPTRAQRKKLKLIAHCQHGRMAERNVLHFQNHLARVTECSNSNVFACISNASRRWHVDYGLMVRRAKCESTFDPHNQYAGHDGLYQFLPSTFAETIYRHHDIWSAKWNALAAAEMQSEGQGSQWECTGG